MIDYTQLQNDINQYQKQINLEQSLNRLITNQDFVNLIQVHYTNEYALELVYQLSKFDKDSLEYIESIEELNAISRFKNFLDIIKTNGVMASVSLQEAMTIPDKETYNDY